MPQRLTGPIREQEPAINAFVPGDEAPSPTALEVEAARVRDVLGRSEILLRIFDYLLVHTLAGHTPREIEFAQDVFGRSGAASGSEDTSVRVYIHRLRKKIDGFYDGSTGRRLYIPKGEYRLQLTDEEPAGSAPAEIPPPLPDVPAPPAPSDPPAPSAPRSRRQRIAVVGGLIGMLAGMAIVLIAIVLWPNPDAALLRSFLWRPMQHDGRQIFVVTGDYYLFGEMDELGRLNRMIRDFDINSDQDLGRTIRANAGARRRAVDSNMHLLPSGIADALGHILPTVDKIMRHGNGVPIMMMMSRFEPEILRDSNVIYLGHIAALGSLREPVIGSSGFTAGATVDELIDRKTGRHFVSNWSEVVQDRTLHRDYAYMSVLLGPSGNRILVLAGVRDAGMKQIAQIASDPQELARLAGIVGNAAGFEALYEVRTLGDLNISSSLLIARPLEHNALVRVRPAAP